MGNVTDTQLVASVQRIYVYPYEELVSAHFTVPGPDVSILEEREHCTVPPTHPPLR